MRLRQIALVATDLETTLDHLRAVLRLGEPFRDPGVELFGLRNGVFAIGDNFLEVVSPVEPDASAARYLQRRGGDAGYMVIFQAEDLAAERRKLEALGVRIVWEITLEDIATLHLHPRDVGAAIVSIDQADPPASWRWGGPDWEARSSTELVDGIDSVVVDAVDPEAAAGRWAEILGVRAVETDSSFELTTNAGRVLFRRTEDAHGEGVTAVGFSGSGGGAAVATGKARGLPTGENWVEICGTRLVFD